MSLQRFADLTRTQVGKGGPSDSALMYLLGSTINEILTIMGSASLTGGFFAQNVKVMTAIVSYPRDSTAVTDSLTEANDAGISYKFRPTVRSVMSIPVHDARALAQNVVSRCVTYHGRSKSKFPLFLIRERGNTARRTHHF